MVDIERYMSKQYEIVYLFDSNKYIDILKYINSEDSVYINHLSDGLYHIVSEHDHTDSKYKFAPHKTNIVNGNIYSLYKKNQGIKLLSDNSNPDKDHFSVREYEIILPGDKNKKIKLDFDVAYKVLYDEEYHICMSYLSNDEQHMEGDLVETFWFNKNGYYYENYTTNEYSSLIGNIEAVYNIPEHNNTFEVDLLSKIPDIISYSNNKEYRLFYDKYGIIKSIIDKSDSELDMVKYQLEYNEDCETITSLHPLLYDPFDYRYNDKPLKYWAIDMILYDKKIDSYSFKRIVYEIKGNTELNELLEFIKTPESLI